MTKAGELFTCHRCERTIRAEQDTQYPLGEPKVPVVVCGECLSLILYGAKQ